MAKFVSTLCTAQIKKDPFWSDFSTLNFVNHIWRWMKAAWTNIYTNIDVGGNIKCSTWSPFQMDVPARVISFHAKELFICSDLPSPFHTHTHYFHCDVKWWILLTLMYVTFIELSSVVILARLSKGVFFQKLKILLNSIVMKESHTQKIGEKCFQHINWK